MPADPSAVNQSEGNAPPQSNWYESLADAMEAEPFHSVTMGNVFTLPNGDIGIEITNSWGVMPSDQED